MSSNLIFHVVSKRKWQEFNKGGYYNPEGARYKNGITCVRADRLKDYTNKYFEGRRQLLLLVIDKSRLLSKTEDDKENDLILVENRINMDCILDKILLKPNKDGTIDIDVKED